MKQLVILLVAFSISICQGQTNKNSKNKALFQIFENGKYGFINSSGQIVIKPIFLGAGEFSEGLSHARINGTYGYIDETGDFVIKPQFDYATPFNEGLAIVYKNGKPFFINRKGQKIFECNFSDIQQFENGIAPVKTSGNKFGFIDKTGKLLIDTVFININSFIEGLAVIQGPRDTALSKKRGGNDKRIGVIDTLGNFIVPYGIYEEIGDLENGYFQAKIPAEPWDTIEGYSAKDAFLDKTGKIIMSRDHSKHSRIDGNIHCGLAKMNLYKYWLSKDKDSYAYENNYEGYINLKGEIVINDTTFESVEDFSDNRAFVKDVWNYSIINTQGKYISQYQFNDILEPGFKNSVAFVEVNNKWGLIDTNANFIIQPQFDEIHRIGMVGDYFFFIQDNSHKKDNQEDKIGIAKKDGSIILQPIIQQIDEEGFYNDLLRCIIDDKLTYVDKQGKIIWQQKDSISNQLSNLNLDRMNRGYFYAFSKPDKEDNGGNGRSRNTPKKISKSDHFPQDSLVVLVRPDMKDTIYGNCNGIILFIANSSKKEIQFNAQDSRLYMKVQALDANGEWKDIEYLPSSWCGNSYHTLTLEPKHYWSFVTPVYEGDFKTKLRIKLEYIDPNDESKKRWERKEITIYSNEFEGSINPGQFWRKRDYYPNGLMDPYND